MDSKILNIGILSKADYIKRTIAIAKGEYKPKEDEPKMWFESIKSLAQVLSNENQHEVIFKSITHRNRKWDFSPALWRG